MDFQFISLLLGSSWASGINLYLTAAILGMAQRFSWIELPGTMDTLSHPLVILAALILFAIEFCADKIPYVDSTWDAIHTFVRPFGGAVLGYMALGDAGPVMQTMSALFTGGIALEAHAAKASTRAAINTSPEPVTNIVASVGEDVSVLGMMYLIINHPFTAFLIAVAFIIGTFFVLKALYKFLKNIFNFNKSKETQS